MKNNFIHMEKTHSKHTHIWSDILHFLFPSSVLIVLTQVHPPSPTVTLTYAHTHTQIHTHIKHHFCWQEHKETQILAPSLSLSLSATFHMRETPDVDYLEPTTKRCYFGACNKSDIMHCVCACVCMSLHACKSHNLGEKLGVFLCKMGHI